MINTGKLSIFVYLTIANITTFSSTAIAQQICNEAIPLTAPDNRFVIHEDGTVSDLATGLMWMRCALGQSSAESTCEGDARTFSWSGALQSSTTSTFAGYSDWHLPNIKELASITEDACSSPSINENVFPNTDNQFYWSSTTSSRNGLESWALNFNIGGIANFGATNVRVRLVRIEE